MWSLHRKKADRSKKFFTDLQNKEHIPTMINPKPCGHLCCCIMKGCERVGAIAPALRTPALLVPHCAATYKPVFRIRCALITHWSIFI